MDKVDFMKFIIVYLLGIFLIVGSFNLRDDYVEKNKLIEQQERKIEALQEENSLLHDDVFNLNNQLMKEDK